MKKLCCDPDVEVCNRLKDMLASRGIACTVRHDPMPSLFEKSKQTLPELWVLDDRQFDQAWSLIQATREAPPPDSDAEPSDA
jgi:hypothetical protein